MQGPNWSPVLLAALLAVGACPVQGQGPEAAPLLQDASGDVTLTLADGTTVPADGSRAFYDLRSLSVTEASDSFTFALAVMDLSAGQDPVVGDGSYYIRMAHGEAPYQVHIQRRVLAGGEAAYSATIEEGYDEYFGHVLEALPVTIDGEANTVTVTAPRERLLDRSGAAPFPGRALSDVHVVAASFPIFGNAEETLRARDAMPDARPGASHPVLRGDLQTGHAALFAPDPTRMSNGEATTHAFTVLAHNLGDAEALFTLAVESIPAGWEVTVPVPLLRIPAGGEVNTTVLASTPFAHQHGLFQSFKAVLSKEDDPSSKGTATLGVRYTEVPQPAGHHDTLYLHGRSEQVAFFLPRTTMNSLQEDPNDDRQPIPGSASCSDTPDLRRHFWLAPLDPPLRMGLDFDLTREGMLEVTLQAARPMLGTRLSGELVHQELGVLATIVESAPQDLQKDGTMAVSLAVTPHPAADLVPHVKDKSITLHLTTVSSPGQVPPGLCPDFLSPSLLPGASLRLPLLEYHDPLPVPASSFLETEGPVRRIAAPGSVVSFQVAVVAGDAPRGLAIDLFGVHSDWARLVGPADVRLDAGQTVPVVVEVTIPDGTPASERADLVLQAVPAADDGQASFLRLVVEVDPAAPKVHEEAAAAAGRDSPAAQLLPALALVAVVAAALRRRRNA